MTRSRPTRTAPDGEFLFKFNFVRSALASSPVLLYPSCRSSPTSVLPSADANDRLKALRLDPENVRGNASEAPRITRRRFAHVLDALTNMPLLFLIFC